MVNKTFQERKQKNKKSTNADMPNDNNDFKQSNNCYNNFGSATQTSNSNNFNSDQKQTYHQ